MLKAKFEKQIVFDGDPATIKAEFSLADECHNKHNDFHITGDIYDEQGELISGGCIHEEIVKAFPELEKFIPLHLCNAHGYPMYACDNGLYHLENSPYPIAKKYLRLTDSEFNELQDYIAKRRNHTREAKIADMRVFLLSKHVIQRWKSEADEAIKFLEEKCGRKYVECYPDANYIR